MGVTVTMGGGISRKKSQVKVKKEIEKWRKKQANRAQAMFYTGIVFMFSIYVSVLENDSIFVGFMVIGICTLPFLICLFLLRYAKGKVKKLEDEY